MEKEFASPSSTKDLLSILRDNYEKPDMSSTIMCGILEAITLENWEIAQNLAIIYIGYTREHIHNRNSFEEVLSSYKNQRGCPFSWSHLFIPNVPEKLIAELLIKASKISFWELYESHMSINTTRWLEKNYKQLTNGADPNYEDPFGPSEIKSTVYKIITSTKMHRDKRKWIMQRLQAQNALSLDPIGPDNISPPLLCVKYGIIYLIRYFKNLPGFDKVRTPEGENFNVYFHCKKFPQSYRMTSLSLVELKEVLEDFFHREESKLTTLSGRLTRDQLSTSLIRRQGGWGPLCFDALRELYLEKKLESTEFLTSPEKVIGCNGTRFFHQLGAVIDSYERSYSVMSLYKGAKAKPNFNDERSGLVNDGKFNFEELPTEIFELILIELDILNQRMFFSSSKYLHGMQSKLSLSFYSNMARKILPMKYIGSNSKVTNWKQEYDTISRNNIGWWNNNRPKILNFTTKLDHDDVGWFDDNWLLLYESNKIALWDVNNHSVHDYIFSKAANKYCFLESNANELPQLVAANTWQNTIHVLKCQHDGSIDSRTLNSVTTASYIAAIKSDLIVAGEEPRILNLTTGQIVRSVALDKISSAAHNKINQLTLFKRNNWPHTSLLIADANFNVIMKELPGKKVADYYHNPRWIDQNTFLWNGAQFWMLHDIRKLDQPVFEYSNNRVGSDERFAKLGNGSHLICTAGHLACAWDLQYGCWTNTFYTPSTIVAFNSRYAVCQRYRSSMFSVLDMQL